MYSTYFYHAHIDWNLPKLCVVLRDGLLHPEKSPLQFTGMAVESCVVVVYQDYYYSFKTLLDVVLFIGLILKC